MEDIHVHLNQAQTKKTIWYNWYPYDVSTILFSLFSQHRATTKKITPVGFDRPNETWISRGFHSEKDHEIPNHWPRPFVVFLGGFCRGYKQRNRETHVFFKAIYFWGPL